MTAAFVAVCEAEADFDIASTLADRTLCERIDWLEPEHLPHVRSWRGESPSAGADERGQWVQWTRVKALARQFGIRAHGHFGEAPGEPDAAAARRALNVARFLAGDELAAVLLIRDSDGDERRRVGLEQARSHWGHHANVVIGVAHCKRESWVLSGFETCDEAEARKLDEIRRDVGFDPCCRPERLTAQGDHDKLGAKRVLNELTGGNREREAACWRDAPLDTLRQRGQDNGLSQFLSELHDRLVPLVSGRNSGTTTS